MNQNNDTIYRQAAIDAMCGACSDWCDEGVCRKVSALQKLPSARQWIPVTERLPDKECFVLVTVNDGAIYTDLSLFRHDGRFIEHTGDVIAWQPLPEPWRGEE